MATFSYGVVNRQVHGGFPRRDGFIPSRQDALLVRLHFIPGNESATPENGSATPENESATPENESVILRRGESSPGMGESFQE
jgi:hypothetical protein